MTTPAEDTEKAVAHISSNLGPPAEWRWPGGWPGDIEAALADAVFSARAVYRTKNGRGIHANVAAWRQTRDRQSWSLDELIAEIDGVGIGAWAAERFGNRQHSSTRPPRPRGSASRRTSSPTRSGATRA